MNGLQNAGSGKNLLILERPEANRLLLEEAVKQARLPVDVRCLKDVAELEAYLFRRGSWSQAAWTTPQLVFMDLDVSNVSESLKRIKSHAELRRIPVVGIMTTDNSNANAEFYVLGINSVVQKPKDMPSLVAMVRVIYRYWFQNVELPTAG